MFYSLLVLGIMAKNGSGVGLSKLIELCSEEGVSISKYRMRAILNDLKSVGAVARVKNHWVLRLLGNNLVSADVATAEGYEVGFLEVGSGYAYAYQKELI